MPPSHTRPLIFKTIGECSKSRARVSKMSLPHQVVDTPVFMPVGTQGSLKGLLPSQLEDLNCQIILGNTYHLGTRPGVDILNQFGGLHQFMQWNHALLTDSGGFQMVSLLELAKITEEGVEFQAPHDGSTLLLTPEESMEIQNSIGADVMMQLDDVVSVLTVGPRVEEAMERSVRWLDRCISAHKRPAEQSLFAIIQGGLDENLRRRCIELMATRDTDGYAIGGLSGGEEKDDFWRIVSLCCQLLPEDRPRYCMGVGYPLDMVVCCALGVDMFDCVYPTRTARFGTALTPQGTINLKHKKYKSIYSPIQSDCSCLTCKSYSCSYLNFIIGNESVAASLITIHNLAYMLGLMRSLRQSIADDNFPVFVNDFMTNMFPDGKYPSWAIDALNSVNIFIK